jgi:GDP/UDP-N,N'-diacetylbacillosamine 2-epimerase (hydrolysing)
MKKRKVLAITGIRSEYDILFPILDALRQNNLFELKLIVSGAHLSDWHGTTVEKIKEDGFEIADQIDDLFMTNRKTQRVKGVGILTYAMAQTVERENPDFLFVVGDREESIATALVGNYMDVLTVHLGGGDPVFGNADDPVRFAVSKLAHMHFTMAAEYAENLRNNGEEDFRIFFTGNPALDNIRNEAVISLENLSEYLEFDIVNCKYLMLIKHPLSSEKESTYSQMQITMSALDDFCNEYDYKVVAIYPNTDPGSYDILKVIDEYGPHPQIRFFKSLPRNVFVNLMRNTKALIGNSSMGILEAPFYKVPVINIGNRQKGRLNAGNVKYEGYDIGKIKSSLEQACFDEEYRTIINGIKSPFGDGFAAQNIVNILSSIDLNDSKWLVKRKLC